MPKLKISVLMANYNHGHYLTNSLPAIIAQSYKPTEIVVVDDGSSDDSVEILERFARSTPNFRFLRNDRNRGTLYTINRAIAESTGDYLCFCSADDEVLPGLIEQSLSLLEKYPEAGACTALVRVMGSAGEDQGVYQPLVVAEEKCFIPPALAGDILRRKGTWYMGPAAVFRRQAFLDAGGLRPELGPMSDDFLFMTIALRHGVCHIPAPLAIWRRMEGTYSSVAGAKLNTMLGIVANATLLMRTNYRDLYQEELIARCTGRWLFGVYMRSVSIFFSQPSRLSFLDKLFEWCRLPVMVLLFLRFRRRDLCDVIGRRGHAILSFRKANRVA